MIDLYSAEVAHRVASKTFSVQTRRLDCEIDMSHVNVHRENIKTCHVKFSLNTDHFK